MTDTDIETPPEIRPDMTMAEILRHVPAAQRALFQRYHVGGCSSCGFQPTDTLEEVCRERNLLDVADVIQTILRAHEVDQRMLLGPAEARDGLQAGTIRLIDVRPRAEWEIARIEGSELLDYDDSARYMELPKDTQLVFLCKDGERSMDVASYFIGHGFQSVCAIEGGLDAWRVHVDPSIPDYVLD